MNSHMQIVNVYFHTGGPQAEDVDSVFGAGYRLVHHERRDTEAPFTPEEMYLSYYAQTEETEGRVGEARKIQPGDVVQVNSEFFLSGKTGWTVLVARSARVKEV